MTTKPANATNLTINSARLWQSLMDMAAIGATSAGGVCRLALSNEDKAGRDLFVTWCKEAGCTIRIDTMGNIFARRDGIDNTLPPIMTGSHLDTVPTGGKFDGALGVLAGLEVIRTLNDLNFRTQAPLEIAVWTNEEGSRFSPAMVSSGVFAGVIPIDVAKARADKAGLTLGSELERIGYVGTEPVGEHPVSAFFELHIEQGPILEAEKKTIGVVTAVQALRWYELRLTGTEAHAGTTPMEVRRDALLAAAKIIQEVDKIARDAGPNGRGTVGFLEASPNGRNVISGDVFMCVDLRHPDDDILQSMNDRLERAALAIADVCRVACDFKQVISTPAVKFDSSCIELIGASAQQRGYAHCDMVSGAGHDAVYLNRVTPTAMIFVPCRDGLSHNESEWAEPEDCAAGCAVLLDAMLAFDAKLLQPGMP
jgi:beta-ureidopropionase / N-carbamoyl-L-amino-acid hydrolase